MHEINGTGKTASTRLFTYMNFFNPSSPMRPLIPARASTGSTAISFKPSTSTSLSYAQLCHGNRVYHGTALSAFGSAFLQHRTGEEVYLETSALSTLTSLDKWHWRFTMGCAKTREHQALENLLYSRRPCELLRRCSATKPGKPPKLKV